MYALNLNTGNKGHINDPPKATLNFHEQHIDM